MLRIIVRILEELSKELLFRGLISDYDWISVRGDDRRFSEIRD